LPSKSSDLIIIQDTAPSHDYYHTNFGDPAWNSMKYMLWTMFSLKNLKTKWLPSKVGHSGLDMIHGSAPCHDVLHHQVWWSCIK